MKVKRYPHYKDTQHPWLGSVPSHWDVVQLRHMAHVEGGSTPSEGEILPEQEGDVPWATPADMEGWHGQLATTSRSISLAGLKQIGGFTAAPGSVLFSCRAPVGKAFLLTASMSFNQGCKSLTPKKGVHGGYLAWQVHAVRMAFDLLARGTTFSEINAANIRAVRLAKPPIEEQAAVAAFLDGETAVLDALLAEHEVLLATLTQKRQALVMDLFTRIDVPASKMKGSGIDWLGAVPQDWEVTRLKRVGDVIGGAGFPDEYQYVTGEELPFYKVANLGKSSDGRTMGETEHTVSRATAVELKASVVPQGSILYAKIGAALLLNRRRIASGPCCMDNNMSAFVLKSEKLDVDWAFNWMTVLDFRSFANPGPVPSFSEGAQRELPIVLPPPGEQRRLLTLLASRSTGLDGLERETRLSMESLRERRASIILSAVTGQVDLRPADGQVARKRGRASA